LFNLDELDESADYAVFDDLGEFKYFPSYKSWMGSQKEFNCTDKYRSKVLVHWGKPSVWVGNYNPLEDPDVDKPWWKDNVVTVHVDSVICKVVDTQSN